MSNARTRAHVASQALRHRLVRWAVGLSLGFGAARERTAYADDPLNSSNRATNQTSGDAGKASKDGGHNDFNIVPVAGGSTDIGIGGGFFSGLSHERPGADPYVWNLESAGFISFKPGDGGVEVPYADIYAKLTVPRTLGNALRLEIRPSFTRESTIPYYGLGNASSAVQGNRPDAYFQYGRTHPQVSVDLHFRLLDHVAMRTGIRYAHSWMMVPASSSLEHDMTSGTNEVKALLGSAGTHDIVLFNYGVQWDNRDNETSTHSGSFDTLDVRLSPGGVDSFPYRYGEAILNVRGFVPLYKPHLTLALRFVSDILFGDPPFYELARFDDTYALGGTNGVRGIPIGRYYGKVKVLGNVELRSELFTFHLFKKSIIFGVVAFFDGGRLWADTTYHPELDGTGFGLHYGTGGGLRLQSGSNFVLRADVAWSPDARPIGGYVAAGQMF